MPVSPDIYDSDVDFIALALQYPGFAKKLKSNRQLDFSDPESVRQLTKALLHRDFDITIDLPEDRLCPPVPNRFNYILFIQRLLDSTSPTFRETHDPNRHVIGVDIGTGASAIYPLLCTRQYPKYFFLATEVDPKSTSYAVRNIEANNLQNRIKLLPCEGANLIPLSSLARFDRVDFLMTNPPFYASKEDMLASAKLKKRPPNSACTGSEGEMIYPSTTTSTDTKTRISSQNNMISPYSTSPPNETSTRSPKGTGVPDTKREAIGGEVLFVTNLIQESLAPANRKKIQWFTAMLGRLNSVSLIIEELRRVECGNWIVWEMLQGSKDREKGKSINTRRWGVGWSWLGYRPSLAVARGVGVGVERKCLPPITEVEWEMDVDDEAANETGASGEISMGSKVDDELCMLRLQWQWKYNLLQGVGMSWHGDVWSRRARRRKKRNESDHGDEHTEEHEDETEDDHEKEPALVFKVTIKDAHRSETTALGSKPVLGLRYHDEMDIDEPEAPRPGFIKQKEVEKEKVLIHVRWLQGHDHVLFESFCGWLKRRLHTHS